MGCAVATVATCGGFAAAAGTVVAVASGTAVASTSSAVAASACIGSSIVFATEVLQAASTSSNLEEFANQGNWGTVAKTAGGGAYCGFAAYVSSDNFSGYC